MTRRELLALASLNVLKAQERVDYRLLIDHISLEIAPRTIIKTTGYNGASPGPLLRMKEGQRVTIQVDNATAEPEIVHWHGLHIPSEVDGSIEEGTPVITPHGNARYSFIASPSGTRWYHTHVMAMRNLNRGAYTGQFGFIYIEPQHDPGAFDQEVFLALREWDPYFTQAADSMDVAYKHGSINSHALGFGEPIRVKQGQRVMLRILNASATMQRRIAFAGHPFTVVAMDGNPIATPKSVPILELGPAERIDAIVEMNRPGVWILGATDDRDRKAGLGIVFEYSGQTTAPQWVTPSKNLWDYTVFGRAGNDEVVEKIPLVIEKKFAGSRWVDKWTINGKEWPKTDPIQVRAGKRYRMVFDNRSDEAHPLHLHRHMFELRSIAGIATSGVFKDVVVVQPKTIVEADFTADNPGKTLFHCHQQMHMDYGFMSLIEYV
ncbi:MAG: multicopper oxidase family protein [Bryobacteraceae bacterium]|jgi:FtsP/CotA-like multicopper oxidase with cupredoxin domain